MYTLPSVANEDRGRVPPHPSPGIEAGAGAHPRWEKVQEKGETVNMNGKGRLRERGVAGLKSQYLAC